MPNAKKRKDPPGQGDDGCEQAKPAGQAARSACRAKKDKDDEEEEEEGEQVMVLEMFGNGEDEDDEAAGDASVEEQDEDEDDDNDEQYSDEHEDRLIREEKTRIYLNDGTYTFHVFFEPEQNDSKNSQEQVDAEGEEEVGYLTAFWLPRPVATTSEESVSFYDMADAVSDELAELSAMFCNRQGHVTRIDTGLQGTDVTQGGLVQIYSLEVEGPGHAGKCDLGLHLVHETLSFLKDEWNLCVMVPLLLGVHIQKWPEFHNRLGIDPNASQHSIEQTEGLKAAHLKIKRHFARMGFVQAGRNSEHHHAWYLTAPAYYGNDKTRDGNKAKARWKTKEEIKSLDVFVAPDKHQPKGVDAELHDLVVGEYVDLDKVRSLVNKHKASIYDSRALFVASADNDTNLLKVLVEELGGNVNDSDENENTPLHVAAMMMCYESTEYLLRKGAKKDAINDKGHTPLQTAQESLNNLQEEEESSDVKYTPEEAEEKEKRQKCLDLLRIP